MRRREFFGLVGGAAAIWPRLMLAQTLVQTLGQKAPARIGFLAGGAAASIDSAYQIRTIKQGLQNAGLVEVRDYVFEPRFAAGQFERFPELARELAQAGASLILANTIASVQAAQHLVPALPVVMIAIHDPVAAGLVASFGKPGGLTTGIGTSNEDLTPRMLELQRAILPRARSIAVLHNPADPSTAAFLKDFRVRAGVFGISARGIAFQSRDELEAAFADLGTRPPDALFVVIDSGTSDLSDRIAALARLHRLAAFSNTPEFARLGGLMAYGASREQLYLRSGYFVKRILDGARPGDLAVEKPARLELWINLRTARALDIAVPAALLAGADQVIQ
jgi:putative ABC transport system substrate-binding protein